MPTTRFVILGQRAVNFNGSTYYRVKCQDINNVNNVFFCKSNESVTDFEGGTVEEILPKGAKIKIGEDEIELTRVTGVEPYWDNLTSAKGRKLYSIEIKSVLE